MLLRRSFLAVQKALRRRSFTIVTLRVAKVFLENTGRDAQQPGIKRIRLAQLLQRHERAYEGFLSDLLGFRGIREPAEYERKQRALITFHQQAELFRIPAAAQLNALAISYLQALVLFEYIHAIISL